MTGFYFIDFLKSSENQKIRTRAFALTTADRLPTRIILAFSPWWAMASSTSSSALNFEYTYLFSSMFCPSQRVCSESFTSGPGTPPTLSPAMLIVEI